MSFGFWILNFVLFWKCSLGMSAYWFWGFQVSLKENYCDIICNNWYLVFFSSLKLIIVYEQNEFQISISQKQPIFVRLYNRKFKIQNSSIWISNSYCQYCINFRGVVYFTKKFKFKIEDGACFVLKLNYYKRCYFSLSCWFFFKFGE